MNLPKITQFLIFFCLVGNDLLADIIINYKKVAGTQGVSGKQQIMSLARNAHVIDLLVRLFNLIFAGESN
jgi:hypothetical protein